MGTGHHLSNGRVASSATTVRLRRPPHGYSTEFRSVIIELFDRWRTRWLVWPRMTTGALLCGRNDLRSAEPSLEFKSVPDQAIAPQPVSLRGLNSDGP